ncbi:hypothetical protein Tco_0588749 [Tanacetum coccineum]
MAESAKRHEENSNIIKEIRASTNESIRNQGASIKTLEIQIGQMSKVLQERGIEGFPGSTKPNPREHLRSQASTTVYLIRIKLFKPGHFPSSNALSYAFWGCTSELGTVTPEKIKQETPKSTITEVCNFKRYTDKVAGELNSERRTSWSLFQNVKELVAVFDDSVDSQLGVSVDIPIYEITYGWSKQRVKKVQGSFSSWIRNLRPTSQLPADRSTTELEIKQKLIRASADHCLFRSSDGGEAWSEWCCARHAILQEVCVMPKDYGEIRSRGRVMQYSLSLGLGYGVLTTCKDLAVKRIFRYLKGQPKLGLWYPRDSPFDLEAFSDSDYARASLDRKSTTRSCQFLGKSLISWQCKKQTIVANSTTEAEYVAVANCYGQHIEIRHHFIIDSNEKKLIQVIKIHTDYNVADLLTKAFDVSSGPIHLDADETVYKEWEYKMERAATTASSLEADRDSEAQTRFEAASKQSNDLPLSRVNTLGSGEDNMKLKELMELCTKLSERILDNKNRKSVLGRIVGCKRLQDILRVTAVQLQLLSDYYCWKDYADRDEIKD